MREVWQGTCMRTNFTVPPPDGHIRATASPGSLAGGYLLFSAAHNHRSNGTFGSFDAGVPVKDGWVTHPPGRGKLVKGMAYTLAEFTITAADRARRALDAKNEDRRA